MRPALSLEGGGGGRVGVGKTCGEAVSLGAKFPLYFNTLQDHDGTGTHGTWGLRRAAGKAPERIVRPGHPNRRRRPEGDKYRIGASKA